MVNFQFDAKKLVNDYSIQDTDVLKVQVVGTGEVKILASLTGKSYSQISGIKDANLDIVTTITSAGIYTFDINGFEFLRVEKNSPDVSVTLVGVN